MIFAGGSLASGMTAAGPRTSLAVCAKGPDANPVMARALEFVSPGSFRRQLAAQEVADQRRHLVELVLKRKVAGIEEMQFGVRQVA